jgi:hypothetical protein
VSCAAPLHCHKSYESNGSLKNAGVGYLPQKAIIRSNDPGLEGIEGANQQRYRNDKAIEKNSTKIAPLCIPKPSRNIVML